MIPFTFFPPSVCDELLSVISTLTHCLIVSSSMCCVHMRAENPNLRLCWVTLHVIGCVLCLLQWLVKRAIETREEMGDYVRAYSISQFQKTHSLPEVTVQYQNCFVVVEWTSMWWISPYEYRSWMFSGLRSLGGTEYWLHDLWKRDSQSDNSSFMLRKRSKTHKKVRRWWTCFPRGLESKVRLNWCSNYHHWLYKTWT